MVRRRRHCFLAGFLLLACALALPLAPPGDGVLRALGRGLGYAALALLALTLAIGSWAALRGRPLRANSMLRRDVGIWSAIAGLVHGLLAWGSPSGGAELNLAGWGPFAARPELALLAGHRVVGLLVAAILIGLLLLSNNHAIRALGPRRWKALQRLTYLLIALVGLHVVAHQAIAGRGPGYGVAVLGLIAGLILLRLHHRVRCRGKPAGWLVQRLLPT